MHVSSTSVFFFLAASGVGIAYGVGSSVPQMSLDRRFDSKTPVPQSQMKKPNMVSASYFQ